MKSIVCLAALVATGVCAVSAANAQPPSPLPPFASRDRLWPQSYSDLPANPDIRFGVLANGMRYAVMHNATPSGQTSLRMRVGSGSLEETDAEQGLAHFLEHMSFKGSTHVPNGDMIRILQRHGLAFGADTNAQTGFTQTVFELDLPQSGADDIGTGLMLLRDIGGELTIPAGPMDTERGVVLSEERLRDTPSYDAFKAQWRFQFKGQRIADRLPIGKVDIIKSASPELLRTLYRANYRPDRTTLIAVGDFDPAAMEAEIKARFSDWTPVGPETPTPDLGAPMPRGEAALVIVQPGISPSLTLSWVAPFDPTPDSFARERRDTVEAIALAALNRRLERIAHTDAPPFLAAGAGRSNEERSAKIASLRVLFRSGGWRPALDAAVRAQRQALRYGFSPAEIAREVTEMRVRLRDAAAGAATRRTPALADEIARSVDEQGVETTPAEDLSLFERFVAGLTPAQVGAALANAFQGSGPLVSVASPEPVEGGEAALKAAFDQAEAAPVTPPVEAADKSWTHTRFGQPGRVVEQREVADLGVTFVRFANGVRLSVKPTAFAKDQVEVAVHFGEGRLGLSKAAPSPWWATSAFAAGGLNDLSFEQLQQVLADKSVSVETGLEDDSFLLSGTTRPQDLDVQLQLLAAYMTAPGWRREAFDRSRNMTALSLSELDSTPEGVQTRDLAALERSGDPRWRLPSPSQLAATNLDDLKAMLQPGLTTGPIEVEMVGDTTVARAIASVAATFGALPPRPPEATPAGGDAIRFPAPSPDIVIRTHKGRADQSIAYIAWPATDFFADMQQSRVLNMTADILGSRLIDQVRIAEGATYSPAAHAELSQTFPGYGFLYGSVETPPTKLDHFYANVDRITTDMAHQGVSGDELERARRPHVQQILKAQQTNGYWTTMLHLAQTDPRRLTLIRDSVPGYGRVSTQDIRRASQTYLAQGHAWRFEVQPVDPSPVTPAGAVATPVPQVKTQPALPDQPAPRTDIPLPQPAPLHPPGTPAGPKP